MHLIVKLRLKPTRRRNTGCWSKTLPLNGVWQLYVFRGQRLLFHFLVSITGIFNELAHVAVFFLFYWVNGAHDHVKRFSRTYTG